jgi:hypothetical protein
VPNNSNTASFLFMPWVDGFAVSLRFRLGRQSKSTRYKATTTVARKRRQSAVNKLGDKQILVVEDHPFVGEILTELLTLFDHPSHAASGKEALKANQAEKAQYHTFGSQPAGYEWFRSRKAVAPK